MALSASLQDLGGKDTAELAEMIFGLQAVLAAREAQLQRKGEEIVIMQQVQDRLVERNEALAKKAHKVLLFTALLPPELTAASRIRFKVLISPLHNIPQPFTPPGHSCLLAAAPLHYGAQAVTPRVFHPAHAAYG